jgi:thioredoxin 1
MSGFTYAVEEATFDELVVERSHATPVVLDIGADWCSPCRVLTPMLEKLAHAYQGKFLLATVDADENMRIAGRHQAKGFPTVIAYSRGHVTDRFHGAKTEGFLRDFLDRLVTTHLSPPTAGEHASPTSIKNLI